MAKARLVSVLAVLCLVGAGCGGGEAATTTTAVTTAPPAATTSTSRPAPTTTSTTTTTTTTTATTVAAAEDVLTVVGTIFGVEGYQQETDGVWTGFETDLLEEIANRLGLQTRYEAAPFDEIF